VTQRPARRRLEVALPAAVVAAYLALIGLAFGEPRGAQAWLAVASVALAGARPAGDPG
jgi:hypothetical protein